MLVWLRVYHAAGSGTRVRGNREQGQEAAEDKRNLPSQSPLHAHQEFDLQGGQHTGEKQVCRKTSPPQQCQRIQRGLPTFCGLLLQNKFPVQVTDWDNVGKDTWDTATGKLPLDSRRLQVQKADVCFVLSPTQERSVKMYTNAHLKVRGK